MTETKNITRIVFSEIVIFLSPEDCRTSLYIYNVAIIYNCGFKKESKISCLSLKGVIKAAIGAIISLVGMNPKAENPSAERRKPSAKQN
jgi:hypothetical protein